MLLYYIIALLALTSSVLCELLNKFEGDTCQWGNATGMCVHIYQCPRAIMYLKQKFPPPWIDDILQQICMFTEKEPIVCCTDCQLVEDNREIILNPDLGALHLTGQKAHDQCVKMIDQLDYKCKETTSTDIDVRSSESLDPIKKCLPLKRKSERSPYWFFYTGFTYIAILGYGTDLDKAQWLCAGTIISEKFILTTGSCLQNEVLGPVSFVSVNISDDYIAPWEKYAVKRSIPHPKYQIGSKYNDIGLVETENTITFSKDVLPACLQTNPALNGALSFAVTWKSDKNGDILKSVTLSHFDTFKCSYFHPPYEELMYGFNETIQICYGNIAPPRDSCTSDIGSPLVAFHDILIEECANIILGVMSIARNCGTETSSGLFTKVIHYVPWIESIVWP